MRRTLVAALCLALFAAACSSERRLRLLSDADPIMRKIGEKLAGILPDAADLELEIVPGEGSVANLERLQRGEADLAIVQNNAPYRRDVRTVLPLNRSVLHILHVRGRSPGDAFELIQGQKVFAGPPGSMGRWFLGLVTEALGIPAEAYRLVESLDDEPGVVFLFRPVSPEVTARIEDRYTFFSIGEPSQLGHGAAVEGLALEYPQLEPFVIPARTYGRANPHPVVTLGVATLLVTREDLSAPLVYDLVEAVVDHKQELATVHPSLFEGISDHFETDGLNFPLHPGARDYLERDEPSVFERYAELAGVSFSVTLTVLSGLVAVSRWRERIKKNRIDGFYARVLRVRAASLGFDSPAAIEQALDQIRTIEGEAFRELMAERLAADESFRIFIALAKDASEELQRRREASET
jgi:TRAP-type uncharacterized transport system substrate-binding protein